MAEQIKEREEMMSDRLTRLIDSFVFGSQIAVNSIEWNSAKVKELADYLIANGVIVPPCKVGDTAYIDLSDKGYYCDECKVKHIEFNSDWTEPLFTLICYEKADYRTYWLSDFGKEWFLEPTERTKKRKAAKARFRNDE